MTLAAPNPRCSLTMYHSLAPTNAASIFLRQLARGLERALRSSLARPGSEPGPDAEGGQRVTQQGPELGGGPQTHPHSEAPGLQRPERQYVHNMQVVRALPMYGYQPEERLFIKVML